MSNKYQSVEGPDEPQSSQAEPTPSGQIFEEFNINTRIGRPPPSPGSANQSQKGNGSEGDKSSTGSSSGGLSGILSLSKKKKQQKPPKIQSGGIVNYSIGQHDDSESDASSRADSIASSINAGYDLPFGMQSTPLPDHHSRLLTGDVDDDAADDSSIRTPIPKAPPPLDPNGILPSSFLRGRNNSVSNVSDLSEEESSVVKRQKREDENVGRLVQAAKAQQSYLQAWFTAGNTHNALPPQPQNKAPKNLKKKTAFNIPMKGGGTGPIDLDSGDVWDGDEESSKMNMEIGSFNYTTHSGTTKKRGNKGFLSFGVPEDEDLTTYYQENKCLDWVVCTIGNTKCSLLAFTVFALGLTVLIAGGTAVGVYFGNRPKPEVTSFPSISPSPTISVSPSLSPTDVPSVSPSISPSSFPTSSPSEKPSFRPTSSPSSVPSSKPSSMPSRQPSVSPTRIPTTQPSEAPSLSMQPSPSPSSQPSTFFSATSFEQIGADIPLPKAADPLEGSTSINLSKDGNILAVGNTRGPDSFGSVTMYKKTFISNLGLQWRAMGETIKGKQDKGFTGHSLQLTDDGLTVIIGEYYYDTDLAGAGLVRIFTYTEVTDSWDQLGADLVGSKKDAHFGYTVAMSQNGNRIAVGANNHNGGTGQVIAYTLNQDSEWVQTGVALDGSKFGARFGSSVSLSGDGDTLAVGAPDLFVFSGGRITRGYAIVYKWDADTIKWQQYGQSSLSLPNSERFGYDVSLSENGSHLAIGTMSNVNGQYQSGTVSIFQYGSSIPFENDPNPDDEWHKIGEDLVGFPSVNQQFGTSVAIAADGRHVIVGALNFNFDNPNRLHIYRWNGQMWDTTNALEGGENEEFGWDVDIVTDAEGRLTFIAAAGRVTDLAGRGVARVYEWKD